MSLRRIIAFIILILALVPLTGCIEMEHQEESSEGLFVGAYLEYKIEGPFIEDGYIYMKIIDENETHYKMLSEFYLKGILGTLRNSSIEWVPKDEAFFEEQKSWTYEREEEIVFNKKAIKCQKYVFKNETEEAHFWVYLNVPIKVEYKTSFFLGNLTFTAWLNDTNIIEIPKG